MDANQTPQEQTDKLYLMLLEIRNKLDLIQEESLQVGDWVSQDRTMKILQRKETSLYHLRKDGELVCSVDGNKIFYSMKSIIAYLDRNSRK